MKKYICLFLLVIGLKSFAQNKTISTNLVDWGTLSMNAEVSMGINEKQTLHFPIAWNPWTFANNKKMKHLTVSPQWRYWKAERYLGHFFGANMIGSRYNVTKKEYRYDGWAYGLGGSWGYAWILGKRWNLEVQAGVGVVRTDYKRYDCGKCGDYLSKESKWFVVPNRVAVSFVYMF